MLLEKCRGYRSQGNTSHSSLGGRGLEQFLKGREEFGPGEPLSPPDCSLLFWPPSLCLEWQGQVGHLHYHSLLCPPVPEQSWLTVREGGGTCAPRAQLERRLGPCNQSQLVSERLCHRPGPPPEAVCPACATQQPVGLRAHPASPGGRISRRTKAGVHVQPRPASESVCCPQVCFARVSVHRSVTVSLPVSLSVTLFFLPPSLCVSLWP